MRTFSGGRDHEISPACRPNSARQRHVFRDEALDVVARTRPQALGTHGQEGRAQAASGERAAPGRAPGCPPLKVDGHEPRRRSPAPAPLPPGREPGGLPRRTITRSCGPAGRRSAIESPSPASSPGPARWPGPPPVRPRAAPPPSRRPRSGEAQGVGQGLGRGQAHTEAGERSGPGAHHHPDQAVA